MLVTIERFKKMSRSNKAINGKDDNDLPLNQFVRFPAVVDERIDTKEFLKASRGVVKIIDKFGKLFAPVKYDMQGSIEKLNARYLMESEVNGTLQDMLLLEIATGDSTIATEALLWLTRSLHLIQSFFEKIVKGCTSGRGTEDVGAALKKSYEESLEPYHGWMAFQLFGLLSRMVPSRTYILQTLADDVPGKEETTLIAMGDFSRRLKWNVMTLNAFFEEHDLVNTRDYIPRR